MAEFEAEAMATEKWPKREKRRGKVLATIYRKSKNYAWYRVVYSVDGHRHMKSFATYSGDDGAKKWAEEKADEIAESNKAASLTARQAEDALAALKQIHAHYVDTGKRLTLLDAVSVYCSTMKRLGERFTISDCVDGFLRTVAVVKRKDVLKAVEDFIAERKRKTVAEDGKRPKLSPEHFYNTSLWLKEFGNAFAGHAVCDLTAQHLAEYMKQHSDVGPKTRNERRAVVRMFFKWCAEQEQDYLARNSRIFEAKALRAEDEDENGDIECYTPKELRLMLDRASQAPTHQTEGAEQEADFRELVPVIALGGLAGMRLKEIMRATWEDVFRVEGHIEVKAHKSKTRSRRLIQTCAALAQWLEPFSGRTGKIWPRGYDMLGEDFADLCRDAKITKRRNGLRHSFVSAHFAVHADENLTSMQAGNSPAVVHKHYKGLMTKKEGEAWFNVQPERPENVVPLDATKAAAVNS